MATPGKNDVQITIAGEARQLENLIERLMGMIRQLQEAAQSVSVGGVGGGMGAGGAMGGGLPGGFASGSSMVNRSAQPSAAPMGTAGRGTSAQPRSVSPGMGGASGMVGASTSYYTPAFTRADGGIQSMAGGRFGPMLPGHVMSQVNPGMAYDPSVQNATGLGRYFPSDLLQGMSSYFPSDYGMGSARRSASVIEQSMMNPRSVATWGVRGGGIPDFTDGWMTSQFPSEMYGGMPVGGAIAQMYQGDAARLSAIRARGTAVGMGARVIGAPSPLTGMPFASDIGHGPAAQSAAIMMGPERAAFGNALMGAVNPGSIRDAITQRIAPYGHFAEIAMITASMAGGQYYQSAISSAMTGRQDRMALAGAGGAGIGGIFGGLLGNAIIPGVGAYVGTFAGAQLGQSIGQYLEAPQERSRQLRMALMPIAGMSANLAGDLGGWEDKPGHWINTGGVGAPSSYIPPSSEFRNPMMEGARRLVAMSTRRARGIASRYFNEIEGEQLYSATAEDLASGYSGTFQALIAAGVNPESLTGVNSINGRMVANSVPGAQQAASRAGQNSFGYMMAAGMLALRQPGVAVTQGDPMMLYDYLNSNAAMRYGNAGPEVMRRVVDPILGNMRAMGGGPQGNWFNFGNPLDIMMKYGPQNAAQYFEAVTPFGTAPQHTLNSMMAMSGKLQENDYLLRMASLMPRGAGHQTEMVLNGRIRDIEAFEGGKDSMTYRETQARRRAAMFQRFAETDTVEFDIPMTRLQGQLDRSQLLPYAPGYSMGMEMQGFNARNVHLRTLEKRLETLKSRGDLSESQELAMVGQIEGLRTRNAQTIASLSEGMENRLPAMSAGRPFWAGRFNSMQLAAMYMRGPARFTGAYGGGQLAMQDDFARGIGLPSGTGSLSAPMNNQASGQLERIAKAVEKMAGEKTLPERRDPGGSRGRIN